MKKVKIPLYGLADSFQKLSGGDCLYYWLSNGNCLYIGITSDIKTRIKAHITNFERFIFEADTLILEYPFGFNKHGGSYYTHPHGNRQKIAALEYVAIKTHKPKYNINATSNKISENERRFTVGQRVNVRDFYSKLNSSLYKKSKSPIRAESPGRYFTCEIESRIHEITSSWDYKHWSLFRQKHPYDTTYTTDPLCNKWDYNRITLLNALESYVSENQY